MLTSIEGVYRDGKIQFLEEPPKIPEARVIVTFIPAHSSADLQARGIDKDQAAELRWRLQAFAEDWNRPEMDVYDDL